MEQCKECKRDFVSLEGEEVCIGCFLSRESERDEEEMWNYREQMHGE